MEIITTYIGTIDGVNGIWCGFKPEGAIITEEKTVMRSELGYILKNKETEEKKHTIIIQTLEEQNNWEEIEDEDFPRKEIRDGNIK